jgi:hypothetical protein
MATVPVPLSPAEAEPQPGTAYPQPIREGTNFPVVGLAFDAATDEAAFWDVPTAKYGTGDWTISMVWYASTAVVGDVVLEAALAANAPESSSQDITTKALATPATVTDSHLGTTAKREMRTSITLTGGGLDAVAANKTAKLRIRRLGSNVADTMVGDCVVKELTVSYSDT